MDVEPVTAVKKQEEGGGGATAAGLSVGILGAVLRLVSTMFYYINLQPL